MPDKTHPETLEGVELCERVALAMGWEPILIVKDDRYIFRDNNNEGRVIDDEKPLIPGTSFRPDIDGNHLAEVIAEIERRGWDFSVWPSQRELCVWADGNGFRSQFNKPTDFPVALLRAFVAAAEREQEKKR